jgi:IclR family transcriptional regulator, acetate operon repressor
MAIQQKPTDVAVLQKAISVIRACDRLGGNLSLGDISSETNLPRSTVQRIVNTLAQEGFIATRGKASSIGLGPELLAFGAADATDIVEHSRPFLERLAQDTGETVDMSRLNRDHTVFINQVAGSQRLRAVSSVGQSFPLHCSAHGKAMLAILPEAQVMRILGGKLESHTAKTITRFGDLRKELDKIRQTGIAVDSGEHSQGISAVGMAFRARSGLIFAISIPIPTIRFKSQKAKCSKLLRDCVALVEKTG